MSSGKILQAAIAVLLLFGAASASAFVDVVSSRYIKQSMLVFKAEDVRSRRIPARIHVHGAPLVFGSQVNLACLGVNLRRDEFIVFLPESQLCIPLNELSVTLSKGKPDPGSFRGIERDRSRLEQRLQESTFVVMQPQASVEGAAGVCSCPGNRPPVVTVNSGSPQEVMAGASITSIGFSASDVDSEVLMEDFSFTLNGGSKQLGLPGGLGDSCVPGIGTLSCTVSGTAPATAGAYLIKLEVSDGFSLGSATATLTVTQPPLEQIFADGFEETL